MTMLISNESVRDGLAEVAERSHFEALALSRHLVRLRLAREARFHFEHGGVLRGLLSRALGRHELPPGLIVTACESGRVRYQPGDAYHLGLSFVGGSERHAGALRRGLERIGARHPEGPRPVLGGNFVLEEWTRLEPPDFDAARAAVAHGPLELILTSPLRLERPESLKRRGATYLNADCFPAEWFLERLWRRIFFLRERRYPEAADLLLMPPFSGAERAHPRHLLWVDVPVSGAATKSRPYTLGGVRGRVIFEGLSPTWRSLLVLGSYLNAGQKVHYGLGSYLVAETPEAARPAFVPARTLLDSAADPAVLQRAADHVFDGLDEKTAPGNSDEESSEPDLEPLRRQLLAERYQPPPLRGFVLPKDDGGVRPLAVPSLRDRIAQRAAVEVLAPALDTLLEDASYAYRRGFSRQGAARAIEQAYAEGYRYVLDADIHAFFDQVDWALLFAKLRALYPHEPLVELLEAWVRTPVIFDRRRIERRRGLPQGSPVSPLLANLYLDTFDEALLDRGFRLVRFADDFVILARDPEAARRARDEVVEALADLRLELNADETTIRSFDDGFSYLGYLFCRSVVIEEEGGGDEETSPRPLEPDDVPPDSWLAGVPLRRLDALVRRRGKGRRSRGVIERVPLAAEGALGAPARRPLYVSSPDVRLFLRDDHLVVESSTGEDQALDVPIGSLSHAVFWGRSRLTVPVLLGLARRGVPSFFCRASGELESTFGEQRDDWRLWLAQARFLEDDPSRIAFAAEIVRARLLNLATLTVRFGWEGGSKLAADLRQLARETVNKSTVESIRGLEGRGAALAFGAFGRSLPPQWGFTGRARRPPPDPVNSMLSFGYTLLHNHVATALIAAGLSPRLGIYHRPRGAHRALASDLIEELRHLVEALVWTMVRRRQLKPEDFRPSADGRYPALLIPPARRLFLDAFERRLLTAFTPEGEDDPISYREFLARQARQARALVLGEVGRYRPLVLRA